jgi:hypothetical protein
MKQEDFVGLVKSILDTIESPINEQLTLEEAVESGFISPEIGLLIIEAILTEEDDENWDFGRSREERKRRSMQSSMQAKGISSTEPNFKNMDLVSRLKHLTNKAKEHIKAKGLTGAAASARTDRIKNEPMRRLGSFLMAKHDQGFHGDANKDYIKRYLNKRGMLDKLKKAGLSTKVKVKLDRESGNWHVVDSSGNTHVIEQLLMKNLKLSEDKINSLRIK